MDVRGGMPGTTNRQGNVEEDNGSSEAIRGEKPHTIPSG